MISALSYRIGLTNCVLRASGDSPQTLSDFFDFAWLLAQSFEQDSKPFFNV